MFKNLDGFEPFYFNRRGKVTVSVGETGVSFSKRSVDELKEPRYVNILINYDTKSIAVVGSNDNNKEKASKFFNPNSVSGTVVVASMPLRNELARMMDWDIHNSRYRCEGSVQRIDGKPVLVFNLTESSEQIKQKPNKYNSNVAYYG